MYQTINNRITRRVFRT